MTMKINLKDQYLDKFNDFIKSLPSDAIKVDNILDNSISMEEAKEKVQKAMNNISSNEGLDLDTAFSKVDTHQ